MNIFCASSLLVLHPPSFLAPPSISFPSAHFISPIPHTFIPFPSFPVPFNLFPALFPFPSAHLSPPFADPLPFPAPLQFIFLILEPRNIAIISPPLMVTVHSQYPSHSTILFWSPISLSATILTLLHVTRSFPHHGRLALQTFVFSALLRIISVTWVIRNSLYVCGVHLLSATFGWSRPYALAHYVIVVFGGRDGTLPRRRGNALVCK